MLLRSLNKFERTYNCQKKHLLGSFARSLFNRLQPMDFKKHPKRYLRLMYTSITGDILHLTHPRDINECLISLNLSRYLTGKDNKTLSICADKYRVTNYIRDKGYPEILVQQYGAYDSFAEIPFHKLPNQFVIKMNNASGRNVICTDKSKLDLQTLKKQFDEWILDRHYGLVDGEWHYELIDPKIVVEEYLSSLGENSLIDYKFHCFKGNVHSCFVCYDRIGHCVNYDHYSIDWHPTYSTHDICCKGRRLIPKPKHYDRMLEIASKLSEGHPYVRVDLYEVDNKVLFGELTMTPSANMQMFYKQEMLNSLGAAYHKYND